MKTKTLILFVLASVLLISGCANTKDLKIKTKPVEKPQLSLQKTDPISLRSINWMIVTPGNSEKTFREISKNGNPVVIGLTVENYKKLGLNLSDIKSIIRQQKSIIESYRNYYEKSSKAIKKANKRLKNKE